MSETLTRRAIRMTKQSVPALQAIVKSGSLSAAAAAYELRRRGKPVPITGEAHHKK